MNQESPPPSQPGADRTADKGPPAPTLVTIQNVSWLELFYDLVMVAAIIVFSHGLSVVPTWETALKTVAIFSILWWVWLITTLLVNIDPSSDTVRRGLLFGQMLTMVLLIIVGSHTEKEWRDPLAPLAALLLLLVAALHEVTRRTRPELAPFTVPRRNAFVLAAVLAVVSGAVPPVVSWVMWSVIALLMVVPVLLDRYDMGLERPSSNLKHLAERLAALTTIVIGESFIRVALTSSGRHLYEINFVIVCLEFVVVCSLWIAYFDSIAVAGMPLTRRRQRWWLISHLPLHIGIIGMAVGLGAFALLRQSDDLTDSDIWLLTAPLVTAFLALGALGICSARVPRLPLLLARIATALLIVVISWITWYVPQVTISQGVAGYGVVTAAYVLVSHVMLRRTTVPRPAMAAP